jgi:hypothetical protein
MTRRTLTTAMAALVIATISTPAQAQNTLFHGGHAHDSPTLHLTNRWKECSFQLDAALTQSAWRQFTREAGLVVYFRPLTDARPMGKGKFEMSVLQWQTNIDDHTAAWNDTFVHPDAEHWLFEGPGLKFPGLTVRAGITDNMDVGIYATKNPNANYGVYGVQLQRALFRTTSDWAAAARVSYSELYGPEDVDFRVYGADLVASKTITMKRWATLSPYAGVSTFLGTSHEKSAVVALEDEQQFGAQASVGATLQLSKARLAAEYNVARVPSISMKIGFGM